MKQALAFPLLILWAQPSLASGKPTTIALHVSEPTKTEGDTFQVLITKAGGNGRAVPVTWNTTNGQGGKVSVPAGGVNVTVNTADDNIINGTRTVGFNAVANTGAVAATTLTVLDNDQPPPPQPIQCDDGTTVIPPATCPIITPPEPTPEPVDPPGSANNPLVGQAPGVGAPDIPTTDHDVMQDVLTGGTIPSPQPASEPVGAFRFICWQTNILPDDPTVFYQQPGKSHLHDQTGNTLWNAFSNYGNLRRDGGSHCNSTIGQDLLNKPVPAPGTDPRDRWAGNRTPYWQPAFFDGKGNMVSIDYNKFYYKRFPASSAECTQHIRSKAGCAPLPNGLKFLFGANVGNPDQPYGDVDTLHPNGIPRFYYFCPATGGKFGTDLKAAIQCVQAHDTAGTGGELIVQADAPNCWDGVHLDSADHRSHLAYTVDSHMGYTKCPDAYPYYIPAFTYSASYTIMPTDDASLMKFSCDDMDLTKPPGWCFHVDYGPAAWDNLILKTWTENCIDKKLNCSGGHLGNGWILKGAGQPIYNVGGVYHSLWKNPVRLIPLASLPGK